MHIITLTTDMGLNDHYLASLKGALLSSLEQVQLIDISHNVKAFDIGQASYYVKNCFQDFPEGTIHLIGVDCEPVINFGAPQFSSVPAILKYKNHYFVSNDNGIFSLIVGEDQYDGFWHVEEALTKPGIFSFPVKNLLAPIVAKIVTEKNIDDFAEAKERFNKKFLQQPVIEPHLIIGAVSHIDHYGNLITNIDKDLFTRQGENAPFTIFFRRKEYYIDEISTTYSEVPPGEKLALFNSDNLLEIAINRGTSSQNGGANSLFGLHVGDSIRIEFSPKGSKETLDSLF